MQAVDTAGHRDKDRQRSLEGDECERQGTETDSKQEAGGQQRC